MSVVTPENFDSTLSESAVWQTVNTMPVSYRDFAFQGHYWGRMYGVITGEKNEQHWEGVVANQCLRDSLWRTLHEVTDQAEQQIGFHLSRRAITTQLQWNGELRLYTYPGIEAVDVVPQWSDVVGYEQVPVSPFIAQNVTVTPGSPNLVEIPEAVCSNPLEIFLRRDSDNGSYGIYTGVKPYRDGLGNWVVALDDNIPYNILDQVNVQDTRYTYVDIDPADCDGTLYPVYPGTNQIIPLAKPVEVLQGGQLRYWFYIYTLVNTAFYNYEVNLIDAEFYKLLEYISFKCYEEVPSPATLTVSCTCGCESCATSCEDAIYQLSTTIDKAQQGVLSFVIVGKYVEGILDESKCFVEPVGCSSTYTLRFSYITNPLYLPGVFRDVVPIVKRAIMHRSAAELPLVDCGCHLDDKERLGFIWKQQEMISSSTVRAFSGDITTHFKYGDLRGQLEYTDLMSKVPKYKFTLMGGRNGRTRL